MPLASRPRAASTSLLLAFSPSGTATNFANTLSTLGLLIVFAPWISEAAYPPPHSVRGGVAEFQCPLLGVKRTSHGHALMSASLIGRLGSSAFRLSATAVSMSLAG